MQGFETKSLNGRPAGTPEFIARVEARLGRSLRRGKPGRKAKGPGGLASRCSADAPRRPRAGHKCIGKSDSYLASQVIVATAGKTACVVVC